MTDAHEDSTGCVRIPELGLAELRIEHLSSAIDMSIGLPAQLAHLSADIVTGYTEWTGRWCGVAVSIGWDWAVVRGEVILLNAAEIRTNIRLIAADGSTRSSHVERGYIARWLKTLPWSTGPIQELLERNTRGPQ